MTISYQFGKLCFRCGLAAMMIMVGNLGCANSPPTRTAYPSAVIVQPTKTISIQPTDILSQPHNTETASATEIPTDVVWEMISQVNRDRALADLRKLTGEEPICAGNKCYTITNRLTGSQGLQKAKEYIYNELVGLGYSVEAQSWSLSGYADQNIIARKPGVFSPSEEVYFVAHLDGVKKDEFQPYPSADDNASGAVDILELARVLSSYSYDRTIVLFFSTGEEEGTLGVRSYVEQLSAAEISAIKYVVDIDMVGYDGNDDGVMQLWHGDHPPSLALTQTISDTILAHQFELVPEIVPGCG